MDVRVTIANSMEEIGDRANVLAIVDDVKKKSGEDALGIAQIGGRIGLMKVDDLKNHSRREEGLKTAVHEMLHTLGAGDRHKTDKDIMNYEPHTSWDLHSEHAMEIWSSSVGQWTHIWNDIVTKGDAKPYDYETTSRQELADFLKDHVEPK